MVLADLEAPGGDGMLFRLEGMEPTRIVELVLENGFSREFAINSIYGQIYRDKELFPPGVGIYYLDGRSGEETAGFLNGARNALLLDIETDLNLYGNPIAETALLILREMYDAAIEYPLGIWEVRF